MADFGKDDLPYVAPSAQSTSIGKPPAAAGTASFGAEDIIVSPNSSAVINQPQTASADRRDAGTLSPMETAYPRSFGIRPELTPVQAQTQREWYNLPFFTRLGAVARNTASGVPIAGRFVEDTPETQLFRRARPTPAAIGRFVGHAAPYAVAGAAAPAALANLPISMAFGAALEGGDAAAAGGDRTRVISDAALGALSAIPGHFLSKLVSPAPHTTAATRSAARSNIRTIDEQAAIMEELGWGSRIADSTLGRLIDASRSASRDTLASTPLFPGRQPSPTMEFVNAARDAALGGAAGHIFAGEPMVGAALGLGIPRAAGAISTAGRAAREMTNRFVERNPNSLVSMYLENQLLNSPQARALLQILAMPGTQDIVDTSAGRQ